MPPRGPPKVYQLQLKTHKLTISLTVPPSTTISSIKEEGFAALTSVAWTGLDDEELGVPKVESVEDFVFCLSDKKKTKGNLSRPPILSVGDVIEDETKTVRDLNLLGWDVLFFQFKEEGSDNYLPVEFTQTPFDDDDEEEAGMDVDEGPSAAGPSPSSKRKAPSD